ncbi:HNH endonuclease [Burkholderia cepacia]|uniref:HNH endonuclease n=1 Tax=Burkholderia cepacia TaxID=292 RepID=UPI0009C03184
MVHTRVCLRFRHRSFQGWSSVTFRSLSHRKVILDTTEMTLCIYCRKPKSKEDLTLEHVIPQFLGGACV